MHAFLAAIRSETPAPVPGATPVPAATPELIRDVAPPVDYLPFPTWVLVAFGLLTLVLLLVAGYFLIKWLERKSPSAPPRPRAVALAELEQLRTQARSAGAYLFSIAVSHVLRRYVEAQYRVPALEQTSPEFLAAIAQDPAFTAPDRALLKEFLDACDAIKFAHAGGDAAGNEHLLGRAFAFVQGGMLS